MKENYFDTTVVIPTKNRVAMLRRALTSISKQTLLPKGVVVVDDGSSIPIDDSILQGLNNLNITIINNAESLGGGASRNLGVDSASTKYISFLDDDDAWDENYLAEISKALNSGEGGAAVYASKRFVLSSSLDEFFKEGAAKDVLRKNDLLQGNLVGTTSCVTVDKAQLEMSGGFNASLPAFQDYDCWLRLTLNGVAFHPVSAAFVHYTISVNSQQISGDYSNHIASSNMLVDFYRDELGSDEFRSLKGVLAFFLAKAIHRKNYLGSLAYTFRAMYISKNLKLIALLLPYKVLNLFGVYTS